MADDHYLPFFVGDFLASTATWTGPERGLYMQMLALEWSSGPLPSEPQRLARVLGYDWGEFEPLWPQIREKFQNSDGKLTNVRLEEIRARNAELQLKRHNRAVHAANAKHAKSNASNMQQASPEHSLGTPPSIPSDPIRSDPNPIQEKTLKRARATATRLPDAFSLTADRRKIAETEQLDPDRTFAKFCDYWRAASGAKARKHDWDATWRNWCRTEVDHGRGGSVDTIDDKRRRGVEAAWSRVKTHATQIGCPLQPREHDTPDSFETLVKNWENQNGRRSGSGPATVGSVLAKVGRS